MTCVPVLIQLLPGSSFVAFGSVLLAPPSPRSMYMKPTLLAGGSAVMQISLVSVQVSSKLCSASFGTISHLVAAVRQSRHDAPRLYIVHAFGEHSHFLCAASPVSRIIDVP